MKDFFEIPPLSATPFYGDAVVVRGDRPDSRALVQTVSACVFEDSDAEPVADDSIASEVRTISVAFTAEDWQLYGERVRVGDSLMFEDATFKVVSASRSRVLGWTVKAREVK